MIEFLVFLAVAIGLFYFKVYKKWGYYGKFIFKVVTLCFTLFFSILFLIGIVTYIPDVYEAEKESRVSSRMKRMNQVMNRGDYYEVADLMDLYDNYEPEFDFVWERLEMYGCYNQYLLFEKAVTVDEGNKDFADRLEKYETMLQDLCLEPEYEENAVYGEYFLEEAGIK